MTIGENIKKIRKEKRLTQKQLGKKCGIDEANIRKYELGKQNPKIETIQKIAMALGVAWSTLLEDTTQEVQNELVKADLKNMIENLIFNIPDIQNRNGVADIEMEAIEKRSNYISLYDKLNLIGQVKAIEQVELLTKIPEYRRDNKTISMITKED
ncbi:MAG: helix-turn-helix transcriptional regulator [Lachnospiraceae bacterium]|nr:helix-turn-helix transcriptional regulator [Lachnospiraceae bacterium]